MFLRIITFWGDRGGSISKRSKERGQLPWPRTSLFSRHVPRKTATRFVWLGSNPAIATGSPGKRKALNHYGCRHGDLALVT